jgi:hypothetical protein
MIDALDFRERLYFCFLALGCMYSVDLQILMHISQQSRLARIQINISYLLALML